MSIMAGKKKNSESQIGVMVPDIEVGEMEFVIKGTTPLITHKFSDKARRQIEEKQQKKATKAKSARKPEEEFEAACYKLNGGFGFPANGLKQAAVNACRFTDMKMTVARGAFFVKGEVSDEGEELVKIDSKAPKMKTDMVRLQSGSSDVRYRPIFEDWSMTVRVEYNKNVISPEQVMNLFNTAGFAIGIGDWRPERNGQFGRFTIK